MTFVAQVLDQAVVGVVGMGLFEEEVETLADVGDRPGSALGVELTLCYQHGLSRTWPRKGVAAPNHPPGGCTPSLWAGPAASPTEEHVDEQAVLETGSSPRRLRSKAEEGVPG